MPVYKIKKSSQKNRKRTVLIVCALVAVLFAIAFGLYQLNNNRGNKDKSQVENTKDNVVENEEVNAQEKAPVSSGSKKDGGAVDTGGQDSVASSSGLSSSSGKITVYNPIKNSVVTTGDVVSGTSSRNIVSYRLIDDKVGVIASGSLKVVNKKFSGKFDFSSTGSEGRLDIFYALNDGQEIDVVEVPVRFK